MVVYVQFKDVNKNFRGKSYCYQLNKDEEPLKKGDIIRMMDTNYNYIHSGTRVKVVQTKEKNVESFPLKEIRYVRATLED